MAEPELREIRTRAKESGESSLGRLRRRVSFGLRVCRARIMAGERTCPYCGTQRVVTTARKLQIVELSRCEMCGLSFRWPLDTTARNRYFYQNQYRQSGLTTSLPTDTELTRLLELNFTGSEKDFSGKIALIKSILPYGRVLDFGCSWGYGVHQFRASGYDAMGFEISEYRSAYGRSKLQVPILSNEADLDDCGAHAFDVIFSSHVLEHLPRLRGVFERFTRLLRPGGLLAVFVPNCGGHNARLSGVRWAPHISEIHTMAFDASFYASNMPQLGLDTLILSDPYPLALDPGAFPINSSLVKDCDGDELAVFCLKRARS